MRIGSRGLGLFLGLFLLGGAECDRSVKAETKEASVSFDHTHAAFDDLLGRYVEDGLVAYGKLRGDRTRLHDYLTALAAVGPKEFDRFVEAQQLAFLINAYNAATIELILDHDPIESIQEIPKAWDAFQWPLLGGAYSLNQIEHDLIRKNFAEPRVHLALVCAARGCPPLIAEAYRAERLEEQLSLASRSYLADRTRNRLDRESATLYISKIFAWYGEDFVPRWGESPTPEGSEDTRVHRALVGFFAEHMPEDDGEFLQSRPVRIAFLDYDWALNGRE